MIFRPAFSRALVGTLLLPAVVGALVLWSWGDRADNRDRVPAAVVNLDQPVTQGKGKDEQVIFAGRLLAGGLTSPTRAADGNLGWELTDPESAEQGLRDGDYYAVITIPEDFSASLSSVSGPRPRTAEITVESNDASTPLAAEASRQVAQVAAARLGDRVTTSYLDGLFDRSGQLRVKLGDAADGAGRLADGAHRLELGAGQLGDGAGELAQGLGRLDAGADRLGSGAGRLAAGADRLAAGADRLSGGLGRLERRTDPLPAQTSRLADGASQVADGTAGYAQLLVAWKDACADPLVAASKAQLCAATLQAVGPREENAERLTEGSRSVADGARRLADGTPVLVGALDRTATGATRLADGTTRLAAGTARLASGAARLSDGAALAGRGAQELAGGTGQLSSGSARLSAGSERLAGGLAAGADQIPESQPDAADVVADPVSTVGTTLNPTRDGVTGLAPTVLALGLWLGAAVLYLVRRALPTSAAGTARPGWRLALAGWTPAVGVALAQGALMVLVTLAFGASFASLAGVVLVAVLAATCFTAVTQAFVAVLGRSRGWLVVIAFTALQVVALGGLVPIETAPAVLQGLNGLLPVARAVDAFGHVTVGGQVGSPLVAAIVVLGWGVGGFVATTLAARRRQRLTVADVRRAVAGVA